VDLAVASDLRRQSKSINAQLDNSMLATCALVVLLLLILKMRDGMRCFALTE
jgi:hypothetical protein